MKSYQKFFLNIILIALFGAIFLETVFASTDPVIRLGDLAGKIYNISFAIGTSLAVLMLMFGGFIWLTSLGNPEQIKQAKQRILSALIGLLILVSSASLLALLGIGPGNWLLERIGIDIPEQEPLEQVEVHPRFCAGINLDYNVLQAFLTQQETKAKSLTEEIRVLAGNVRGFVSLARRQCDAMRGSYAKCVEPLRKAQFAKCVQEPPFYDPERDPEGRLIRDGCPFWVRERQNELREQNKKARDSIDKFRKEVIKATIDSEQAKKLKISLEELENCQIDERTILYTREQAETKGIVGALRLEAADFYCCTKD